jgi:hypothetical protein
MSLDAPSAERESDEMRKILSTGGLLLLFTGFSDAAELQGVIADWNCTETMMRIGREKTLRQNRGCSLMKNYKRAAYGLITDDKKLYRIDDPGNQHILELLANTPDKDNLKVVVSGDIQGNVVKVSNITML